MNFRSTTAFRKITNYALPAFAAATLLTPPLISAAIPEGFSTLQAGTGSNSITVFTYKPHGYKNGPLVLVFHGMLRNAEEYCRHAQPIAERYHVIVAAPLFDTTRFSSDDYNRGGVMKKGVVEPREKWTFTRVPEIVDAIRSHESAPTLPYYLLGHSGGGQFLVRFAGFCPTDAKRIVAANPGTDLFPRRDWEYGYGFGGLPSALSNDDALKRYLAAPLILYLGLKDIDPQHSELDRSADAEREGAYRLQRGRACFEFAQNLARSRGWAFNWRKVGVAGIAHDGKAMFAADEAGVALFGGRAPVLK